MAICPVMYQGINALEWGDTQDIREQVTRRCAERQAVGRWPGKGGKREQIGNYISSLKFWGQEDALSRRIGHEDAE